MNPYKPTGKGKRKSHKPKSEHMNQRNGRVNKTIRIPVEATIITDYAWNFKNKKTGEQELRIAGKLKVIKYKDLQRDEKGKILDKVTGYKYEIRKIADKPEPKERPDSDFKLVARIPRNSNGLTEVVLEQIKTKNIIVAHSLKCMIRDLSKKLPLEVIWDSSTRGTFRGNIKRDILQK